MPPLSGSNGAFNYDFNLSTILTDATLAAGELRHLHPILCPFRSSRDQSSDPGRQSGFAGKGDRIRHGQCRSHAQPHDLGKCACGGERSSITMTATTASDPSGVEYFFDETSGNPGGSDSGWQDSPNYTDTGPQPNTTYTYTVTARDKATIPNDNRPPRPPLQP